MKNFNDLADKLEKLNKDTEAKRAKLLEEAFKLIRAKLKKSPYLADYIKALESSTELTQSEFDGWPMRWTRFNASIFIDTKSELERQALENFLSENFCVQVDYQNDTISMNDGPCILINEDGDVLDQDSGKWIIKASEYTDDFGGRNIKTRNELIEAYMEKSGCFPSVVSCDRYGNMFYVSTLSKDDNNGL